MRLFYRLVILNVAVMLPFSVLALRHIVKKTPAVSIPAMLAVEAALLVGNFAITREVARHGGIPSLQGRRWWSARWLDWIGAPVFCAIAPLVTIAIIEKRDFGSFSMGFIFSFLACSSWFRVFGSQKERT
jgi:hypothetical protein